MFNDESLSHPLAGTISFGRQCIGTYRDAAIRSVMLEGGSLVDAPHGVYGTTLSASQGLPQPKLGECGSFEYQVAFSVTGDEGKYVIQEVEVEGEIYDCNGGLLLAIHEHYQEAFPIENGSTGGAVKYVQVPERGNVTVVRGPDTNLTREQVAETYGWIDVSFRAYVASGLPEWIRTSYYEQVAGNKHVPRTNTQNSYRKAGELLSADLNSQLTKELREKNPDMKIVAGSNWVDRIISQWWYCCKGFSHSGFDYSEFTDGIHTLSFKGLDHSVEKVDKSAFDWEKEMRRKREIDRKGLRDKAHKAGGKSTHPETPIPDPEKPSADTDKSKRVKQQWNAPQGRLAVQDFDSVFSLPHDAGAPSQPAPSIEPHSVSPSEPSWPMQYSSAVVLPANVRFAALNAGRQVPYSALRNQTSRLSVESPSKS